MARLECLFGGSFDPPHRAHQTLAEGVLEQVAPDLLRVIPSRQPPHKHQPAASAADRLAMLRALFADNPRIAIDSRELQRDGPSYSVDTLSGLRAEQADTRYALLLGGDAFNAVDQWHRWEEILTLAHIIVVDRPRTPVSDIATRLYAERRLAAASALREQRAGGILNVTLPSFDLSSTQLRQKIRAGDDTRGQLPEEVRTIINVRGLYLA